MHGADRSTGPILGTYSIWVQHFEVTFFSANEARHDVVDVIEDDDDDPSRALPQLFFKNYFSSSSTGGAAAACSLTSDTQIFFHCLLIIWIISLPIVSGLFPPPSRSLRCSGNKCNNVIIINFSKSSYRKSGPIRTPIRYIIDVMLQRVTLLPWSSGYG